MLREGRIVYHGTPEGLVQKAQGKTWRMQVDDAGFEELTKRFYVVTLAVDGDVLDLRMVGDDHPPPDAEAVLPNLEDAYVYFMQERELAEH